jgi:hypothetical protein
MPKKEEKDEDVKKRGRKAKGAKLVTKMMVLPPPPEETTNNIILHLKCTLEELTEYNHFKNTNILNDPFTYNPEVPPEVTGYTNHIITENHLVDFAPRISGEETPWSRFQGEKSQQQQQQPEPHGTESLELPPPILCEKCLKSEAVEECPIVGVKELNQKIKKLKISLYKGGLSSDKTSACFWCSYEFDNAPCFIPQSECNESIQCYGSFCRPECAAAYLMRENIDDSTKFERYHLLNKIYGKVYNYKRNIKPSPDPHYLLDKFYGTLSIQEYRKLLNTHHSLLLIDKPMTRILPELHEDNEDSSHLLRGQTASKTGVYKVKRESEKEQGPTKTSVIREKFGLTQQ